MAGHPERRHTGLAWDIDGHARTTIKPRDQWTVLIEDAHRGYITFEQDQRNQQTLTSNTTAPGEERRAGPVREGPALLQGLVVCGKCGRRMVVNYHRRCNGELLRQYFPKGTDLSVHSAVDLDWVATELNDRPRKRLGFAKPIEEIGPLLLR